MLEYFQILEVLISSKNICKSWWSNNMFKKYRPFINNFGLSRIRVDSWYFRKTRFLIHVDSWYFRKIMFLNFWYSQETTKPLKIPIPTPASDPGGPVACIADPIWRIASEVVFDVIIVLNYWGGPRPGRPSPPFLGSHSPTPLLPRLPNILATSYSYTSLSPRYPLAPFVGATRLRRLSSSLCPGSCICMKSCCSLDFACFRNLHPGCKG